MSLKEKYESYLKKKEQYEKEKFLYDSKEAELTEAVLNAIKHVDVEALEELGHSFNLDKERLSEPEYLMQKMQELKVIRDKLELRGKELLKDF